MIDKTISTATDAQTRRAVLRTALLSGAAALVLPGSAFAQRGPATVSVDELAKSGADLPDIVVGDAKAPVTIVEYASMTCPHCAAFHTTVYPTLKQKYIDTGKVRFESRDYPLDFHAQAVAASLLAHCAARAAS